MNWTQAVEFFKVPKIYQQASLDEKILLTEKIVKYGKEWLSMKEKPSLYLAGDTGCGKTYFAYCLLRGLIESQTGYCYYMFMRSDLLEAELLRAVMENGEKHVLEKYCEVPYLFIDDLGVEKPTERVLRQYYSIIETRASNCLPTVFTSNLKRDDIHTNLGDRIASRLQLAVEIKFPSRDLRKKVA